MSRMTAARPTVPVDRPRPGLRERKKARTRQAIRAAAYALIGQRGYNATTVEQIAERAEVSPSTVLRYFGGKEDIVLTDEYGAILLAELRDRPAGEPLPVSLRHVLREAVGIVLAEDLEITRLRSRLLAEVPALRARMLETLAATARELSGVIAARTGLAPDRLEVRVFSTALLGALMEVCQYWAENDYRDDLADLMDRALDVHGHGLPVPPVPS